MNLPRRQKELYSLLFGRGDVMIEDLYHDLTEREATGRAIADMQRWLSPYITNLNRNLTDHGLKVEPGERKNTYRLVTASS